MDEPRIEIHNLEMSEEMLDQRWNEAKERTAAAVTEYFGERCPEFEPQCECCRRWRAFDELFDDDPTEVRPA